jgi:hypothetical protein|tara:strand:+ start:720 stop:923 length:204 start_codon:yes stop_codon:yes gene_type:complete
MNKMKVQRESIISGQLNTMELNVTPQQMDRFYRGRELTQNIFPHLNSEEREFLISGMMPSEWDSTFD